MFFKQINSPVGELVLVSNGQALTAIYFENQKHFSDLADNVIEKEDDEILQQAEQELNTYFKRKGKAMTEFSVPIEFDHGTTFQKSVWSVLQSIPYGKTISYGDIASELNNPKAVRAVGGAVGKNPISIIVPCHRVIASSGKITGFAGGINKKIQLLAIEGSLDQVKP
jgi:methylated-DNA-[protein]-cysteine S-methyltransferase